LPIKNTLFMRAALPVVDAGNIAGRL
jgi:hypothetical protein